MTRLNRIRGAADHWQSPRIAARQGWIVISGPTATRTVTRKMTNQSGLYLVAPQLGPISRSEYEPSSSINGLSTPRWLQAMWFASVLVSGWALYWVSLSA